MHGNVLAQEVSRWRVSEQVDTSTVYTVGPISNGQGWAVDASIVFEPDSFSTWTVSVWTDHEADKASIDLFMGASNDVLPLLQHKVSLLMLLVLGGDRLGTALLDNLEQVTAEPISLPEKLREFATIDPYAVWHDE